MKKATQLNNEICSISFHCDKEEFYPLLNSIKELHGRKFIPDKKVWYIPITKENIEQLAKLGFDIEESILLQLYQKPKEIKIDESKFSSSLFPFQKDGVKQMEIFGGKVLLADEMGLGKTIQSIEYLNLHPELRPVLIVCPASIKLNWERELQKWLKKKETIYILNSKTVFAEADIHIINYDILEKQKKLIEKINPKIIILDECHKIKNSKAKRTKVAKNICKAAEKIIALSGTPIINRPVEFWNILNILRPNLFNNFWRFAQRYCQAQHNGYGWDFGGANNLDELNQLLLSNVMIRRLKRDVLKDLPEKIKTVIPINSFVDGSKKEYLSKQRNFTNWLMENRSAKQPSILAQIEELKQTAFRMKYEALLEWIENYLESGKKLVVFFTHHKAIDVVHEHFKEVALKYDGRTSINERQIIVDEFQNNPQYKLFLGNIQAAGLGITLTAADSCLFTEFGWTPGEHSQAEDRIHRIGQKNSVNIYYLVATNTIEEDIIAVIDEKRKNLDKVLDGKETETENILSLILKKFLERREE